MKVYEMDLKNYPLLEGEDGETLWIASNRKLTIPDGSSITKLHEIDIDPDTDGIDLIIK